MLPNYVNFSNFSGKTLIEAVITPGFSAVTNPVFAWMTFGKIPENPVVTPTNAVQIISPSANNRFLQTVTVNAIPTTPGA